MENKMEINKATGEIMNPVPAEVLDEATIAQLIQQSMSGEMNVFQQSTIEAGTADTPLKAFAKLETENVLRRHLHINCIHVSRATKAEGEIADKSDYPVMTFDEFPGYRYSGGKRLMQVCMTWAKALGEEFELKDKGERKGYEFTGDRLLPKLNDYIVQGNHPGIIMNKEKEKDYVDVFVLSI